MSERKPVWQESIDERVSAGFLKLLQTLEEAHSHAFRTTGPIPVMQWEAARKAVVAYVAELEQRYQTFVDRAAKQEPTDD